MKLYGLLGAKLGHSYSKIIHNNLFKLLKIDAKYELLECEEKELKDYITKLKNGDYQGFNVTIPYKKIIMNYLDEIDEKALSIGSVNTIYLKDNKVIGTNTDYDGFLATLESNKIEVLNKNCYILGTGGASLAVNKVLKDLGGKTIFVSRNPKGEQISYQELATKKIDLLVNTTPVGMYPNVDASPVEDEVVFKSKVVIDIIFNPLKTKLLSKAKIGINGMEMLLMQAIKAEEIWQQIKIAVDLDKLLVIEGEVDE